MKKIIFVLALTFLAAFTNAQESGIKFGIGPSLSLPTGALQLGYGLGIGAEVTASYPISETLNIIGQTGYHSFSGKTFLGAKSPSAGFIPVVAGIRFNTKGLLVGLGLGLGMYNFGDGDKSTGFTFRPQIGYDLGKIEILAGYSSTSTTGLNANYIGINTAYKF